MANLNATLTCPNCGHEAHEIMPTDRCVVVYDCPACGRTLRPKTGDCVYFAPTLIVRAPQFRTKSPHDSHTSRNWASPLGYPTE
jgi:predicted RNA-binding Zn-ribbon protein involved in translation (DUF1610 family)